MPDTKEVIIEKILEYAEALDSQKAPKTNRIIVPVPLWIEEIIDSNRGGID